MLYFIFNNITNMFLLKSTSPVTTEAQALGFVYSSLSTACFDRDFQDIGSEAPLHSWNFDKI